MKVGKQFNTLTYGEYLHLIENRRKFTDFNTLGLFRSIVETTRLSLEQKLALRQVAVAAFPKTFEFLQLKDPQTYFMLTTLGKPVTVADERQVWENIRRDQKRILSAKKLKHRNFGTYARHYCGIDSCPIKGVMFRQNSPSSGSMYFHADKGHIGPQIRAEIQLHNRKFRQRIIAQRIMEE